MERIRLMYVADVHGSEMVWRKWISAQSIYEIDVSILSGDLSGKVIVPIIKETDGTYTCRHEGRLEEASNEKELESVMGGLRMRGIYPYLSASEEVQRLKADPQGVERLFVKVIVNEMDRLLRIAEENVSADRTVIVSPGNDDIQDLDLIINRHARIVNPLGKLIKLPLEYEMISLEFSNPTPWNTPRECSEEELWNKLEALVPLVSGDWNKVICNFHCPPFGTRLDVAPKLDKNLRPVYTLGNPEFANVGSKSVRRFLEKHQPLVSLHGHIHEASGAEKIGRTTAFNPGSEYTSGIFKAVVVELDASGIANWFKMG